MKKMKITMKETKRYYDHDVLKLDRDIILNKTKIGYVQLHIIQEELPSSICFIVSLKIIESKRSIMISRKLVNILANEFGVAYICINDEVERESNSEFCEDYELPF